MWRAGSQGVVVAPAAWASACGQARARYADGGDSGGSTVWSEISYRSSNTARRAWPECPRPTTQRSLREKRRRPGSRATARARPDAGRLTSGARQEPATDRTRVSGRRGEPPVWIPDFLNRRLPVLGTSPRHGGQSCRGCRSRAEAGEAGQGRCHGEDHDLCFSETRGSDVPSRGVG